MTTKKLFTQNFRMFSTHGDFRIKSTFLAIFAQYRNWIQFFLPSSSPILWQKSQSTAGSFYPTFLSSTLGPSLVRNPLLSTLGYLKTHQCPTRNYSSWISSSLEEAKPEFRPEISEQPREAKSLRARRFAGTAPGTRGSRDRNREEGFPLKIIFTIFFLSTSLLHAYSSC